MIDATELMIGNYIKRLEVQLDEYRTEESSIVLVDSIYRDALNPDIHLINGYSEEFLNSWARCKCIDEKTYKYYKEKQKEDDRKLALSKIIEEEKQKMRERRKEAETNLKNSLNLGFENLIV